MMLKLLGVCDISSLLIHTHLGLGDHFICNGLVRYMIEHGMKFDEYKIPARRINFPTVKQMYIDKPNIEVYPIDHDGEVYNKLTGDMRFIRIGWEKMDYSIPFDLSFYNQMNIPISVKRDYHRINRDPERERVCLKHYSPPDKYIFAHNDSSIGSFDIKIDSDLPVIYPSGFDFRLMDYLSLIEGAEEIHCVDSSFMCMIDLNVKHDKMFLHTIRNKATPKNPMGLRWPTIVDDWNIIEYE